MFLIAGNKKSHGSAPMLQVDKCPKCPPELTPKTTPPPTLQIYHNLTKSQANFLKSSKNTNPLSPLKVMMTKSRSVRKSFLLPRGLGSWWYYSIVIRYAISSQLFYHVKPQFGHTVGRLLTCQW